MAFSATRAALQQLDKVMAYCRQTNNGSKNSWFHNGREYLYELGPTKRDGAVRGKIFELRNGRAYQEAVFHITAEGLIISFPFLPERFFE